MSFGIQQHLSIARFKDGQEAAAAGFDYNKLAKPVTAVEIEKVVVVQNGTEGGNPTVDFVLVDQKGNKYVVMLTGRLLKSIPL